MKVPPELEGLLNRAKGTAGGLNVLQPYTFVTQLGEGGMGTVSLLRHEQSGEQVAIKLIRPELMTHGDVRKRFLREMQNGSALRHVNIVRVLHAVHDGNDAFCLMEYCDGGSLADLMTARGGQLDVDESLSIIEQCLDGLAYAHQAEVPNAERADGSIGPARCLVHRDLKPANVLLSSRTAPVAKLGDFGLAKMQSIAGLSGLTGTNAGAWGTPHFMSRRQLVNFKYSGPEVDVWSIAATLYHMLTGAVPRDFSGSRDPFVVVRDGDPIPILDRRANLPPRLAAAIDKALIESGEPGYRSASDFKAALVRA